jgi:Transposase, Mutator family
MGGALIEAVVFFDAIVVKVRDNNVVANKPAYLAIGIDTDGDQHVLGIWLPKTADHSPTAGEGAGFWRRVTADLRNRGVVDILIACCTGLAGFEDAICAAFPDTTVQTCIVHLIRNSLRLVGRKDRVNVAAELKKIYTAVDADAPWPSSPAPTSAANTPKQSRHGRPNVNEPVGSHRCLWEPTGIDLSVERGVMRAGCGSLAQPPVGGFSRWSGVTERSRRLVPVRSLVCEWGAVVLGRGRRERGRP